MILFSYFSFHHLIILCFFLKKINSLVNLFLRKQMHCFFNDF